MGCNQSHICTCTLSQSAENGTGSQFDQQQRRQLPVDPVKAAESEQAKADAMAKAEQMLDANKGAHFRDTYVRATLVSYGGSAKVFTAVHKHSKEAVAIKAITKVSPASAALLAGLLLGQQANRDPHKCQVRCCSCPMGMGLRWMLLLAAGSRNL